MTTAIDPRILYPENPLFLDYGDRRETAVRLFEGPREDPLEAASAVRGVSRPRSELAASLRAYNEQLDASEKSIRNAQSLRDPATLCVLGGQQAGFLGGPSYTAYKILSIIRSAERLSSALDVPVAPVFWLASEDHDVGEVNRALLLDDDGSLRRISFGETERGRAIETLPITGQMRSAAAEVLARFPDAAASIRDLFCAANGDDYATWHARIWSHLFAGSGLVLVEPRTVRHLAGHLFEIALSRAGDVTAALREGTERLVKAGYDPPLDPDRAGRPFLIDTSGRRVRAGAAPRRSDEAFSADVALRPVFADALFPTIANVLGPSEMAYHAMLAPLYDLFEVPQPIPVPRTGYTLLSEEEEDLLREIRVPIEVAISTGFDPKLVLRRAASDRVQDQFAAARRGVESALEPLLPVLSELDPGLEARWRQTSEHAGQAINRLEERANRADLARRGVSAKRLHTLRASLRPADKPQERGLSFVHFAIRFGIEWLDGLLAPEDSDRFSHHAVTIRGGR